MPKREREQEIEAGPAEVGGAADRPERPLFFSPVRVIALMAVAIFVAEMMVMILLAPLPPVPVLAEAVLDSALLTLLLAPAFFFLLYRPFQNHLAARRRAEEQVRRLAFYDHVTGLPNRALLADRLAQALARAEREKGRLAVLFLDLDHFKEVNDRWGHDVGDQLLRATASWLRQELRRMDTLARLGGDEFILLLPEVGREEDVRVVAEKLRGRMAEPLALADVRVAMSVSIGVSLFPEDGSDAETLLRKADQAMYQVKQRGRGGVLFIGEIRESVLSPGSGRIGFLSSGLEG